MTQEELFQLNIQPPNEKLWRQIKANWDAVAKPLDGLGMLERMICDVGCIQESQMPLLSPRALVIMIADNGIVAQGVSQSGQEVTLAVAQNMGMGKSSACSMAQEIHTDVMPVDIGINSSICPEGVIGRKVMFGTHDFANEPAMTKEECLRAIGVGIDVARELSSKGYRILATGEMGIGNTTTSAAVAAALLGLSAGKVAGRGAGLNDTGLERKIHIIQEALNRYGFVTDSSGKTSEETIHLPESQNRIRPKAYDLKTSKKIPTPFTGDAGEDADKQYALEALRCVGGLDIAGLSGVFIGGAIYHIPVIIDGLISSVAALCAQRLVPGTNRYMLASHCGKEPAMGYILRELGLCSPIHADLALGEGTGALMLFPLLEMAMSVYQSSSSFADIGIEQYTRY